jgi:DNA polymerase elongation subunit (family B)
MEIELDFIFETLLLLTKKKYAARVVKDRCQQLDGSYTYRTEREVKGIIRELVIYLIEFLYCLFMLTAFCYLSHTLGLDLVRRDWCDYSAQVGGDVLDFILRENRAREDVVAEIHEYLARIAKDMREEGKIPLEKFIIRKGLSKNPEEYGTAEYVPLVVWDEVVFVQSIRFFFFFFFK